MKRYLRTTSLITMAFLLAALPMAAEVSASAEDEAAIKSLFEKHTAAFTGGKAADITALFTDDGVLIAPERPALEGKDMIQWGTNVALQTFGAKISDTEVLDLVVTGDLAFDRRTANIVLTSKFSGTATELKATWLEILKREPDGWKFYRAMVVSDQPLPSVDDY